MAKTHQVFSCLETLLTNTACVVLKTNWLLKIPIYISTEWVRVLQLVVYSVLEKYKWLLHVARTISYV